MRIAIIALLTLLLSLAYQAGIKAGMVEREIMACEGAECFNPEHADR